MNAFGNSYLETSLPQICYELNTRHTGRHDHEVLATSQLSHAFDILLRRCKLSVHQYRPSRFPIPGYWVSKEVQLLPQCEYAAIHQHILQNNDVFNHFLKSE